MLKNKPKKGKYQLNIHPHKQINPKSYKYSLEAEKILYQEPNAFG